VNGAAYVGALMGSQQPEVQVDGSGGVPLQVSLNAAVSASSGACPAQPTVRELLVPALVASLGGMRGVSGRSASPAPALGADRAGIGRLAPPFVFFRLPTQRCLYGYVCSGADWSSGPWYVITLNFHCSSSTTSGSESE
jgi:hypothetical protein